MVSCLKVKVTINGYGKPLEMKEDKRVESLLKSEKGCLHVDISL